MLQLSYQIIPGPKETVLLLHGFLGSAQQWNDMVDHINGNYQVLLIELPGHGNSPVSDSYSIEDVAIAIHHILLQEHLGKVYFIGHSMGGYVGCAFAKAYPKQLLSLYLINSCAAADTPARKSQRDRSIHLIQKYPGAFKSMAINNLFTEVEKTEFKGKIELMKIRADQLTNSSIVNALEAMRDRPSQLEDLLNAVFPVVYIYGNHDDIIPAETVEAELNYLNIMGHKIPSGHMSLLTHTDEIYNSILLIE